MKLKTKCDSTQKILSEQINKSLKEVEEELIKISESEYDEDVYNDYCEKRDLLKKHRDLLKKIEEARYSQDDLDEKIEEMQEIKSFLEKANLYKSSLTCPHCKKCVRLNNTVLEKLDTVSDDFSTDKIQQKRQRQKVLETEIAKLENFKKLFEHYTKEDETVTQKLEKYEHISVNKIVELSDLIAKMDESRALQVTTKKKKKQLQEEKKRVEAFEHDQLSDDYNKLKKILQQNPEFKSLCNHEEDNLENYEKTLSELLLKQNSQEKIKDELSVLVDKKRNITREMKTFDTSYEECEDTLEDIKIEIEKINDEIEDMSQKLEELDENNKEDKYNEEISLLEKQKVYLEQLNEKSKIQNDIEHVDNEYKKIEKDCVNYSIILEGIEHAEGVLLSKFIDTINHNLSIHLDAFFEEPMHVQIKPFKESKNNKEKPVINLDIFYKGNETDLTNLSGGEYDRLNLALTLTFNCIANSPVLILDESLSSINQELSTEIIMHIKETISDKLVWMTQHQAVKGMFDRVFQINA
jgi:DNA repair exonuclease SbcCD ATPase subunit